MRLIAYGIVLLTLSACTVPPEHPALEGQGLPPLISVRDFVANVDSVGNFTVSPDGQKLVWGGVKYLRPALIWRDVDDDNEAGYVRFSKRSPYPLWTANSRHILYHHDPSGWERHHVFALNSVTGEKRDLTPFEGVKAFVVHVPTDVSDFIYLMHNRRDEAIFDVYQVNVVTGEETLVYENSENVLSVLLDDDGVIRVRLRQTDDARELQVIQAGQWKTQLRADRFSAMWPAGLSKDHDAVYIITDVDHDKRVLERMDLDTGERTVLFQHPKVDVRRVTLSPVDGRPLMATAQPDYPKNHYFEKRIEQLLRPLAKQQPSGVRIASLSRDEQTATAVSYDHTGAAFYLLNFASEKVVLLGETSSRGFAKSLVPHRPITFKARDGLELNGYLTLPRVNHPVNLPTVLLVHGGPWARDNWGYHRVVQLLANRGYGVLQVNYRGSSGYGRKFQDAAIGEFAGKMHTDLIDGVEWAIANGTTDPKRVAIMGGSYGGYATLVGMTMTPERFACGVDIVGVSDLVAALTDFPAYWEPYRHRWTKFVGDPKDPTQAAAMAEKSPVNFADKVKRPLLVLHGENDPRVLLDQSDRMVAALRKAGKPVDYHVFKNEGHGFGHWKNQLTYQRKTEDFLAKCLGGRSSGFDYYQLGSWAF